MNEPKPPGTVTLKIPGGLSVSGNVIKIMAGGCPVVTILTVTVVAVETLVPVTVMVRPDKLADAAVIGVMQKDAGDFTTDILVQGRLTQTLAIITFVIFNIVERLFYLILAGNVDITERPS